MYVGWKRLVLLVALFGVGGFLFAWSGLFNIAASSGHWAFTEWFLHWTMRNSVRTHSLGIDPPSLDDPALVHRGAGHYASGCAPCHAAPGQAHSPVVREMTPAPPELAKKIPEWESDHLFWIVKHGVKYTGMPAWVAQERDDEVWAMVAFLEKMPDITPAEYRRLSLGPEADATEGGEQVAELSEPLREVLPECARCHGRSGAGRGVGAFPILTGQNETYLYNTLKAYAQGNRHSGIMQPASSGLEERVFRALAAHYAGAESTAAARSFEPPNFRLLRKGATIARRGVPADGIPACTACHGPKRGPHRPAYPRLTSQHADYLAQQIRLFQQQARGGTPFAPVMRMVAERLSEAQIRAVTAYYASLDSPQGMEGAQR